METPPQYHAQVTKSALISLLADRPIAYHPGLAKVLGGVKQAIFVSQLLYWTDKGKRADGYIWKTQEEWTDETGLSAGEQRTARKHLVESGILLEKLKGIPAKLHYRLDLDVLQARIVEYYEQDVTIPHNCEDETVTSIPEITSETTPEDPAADGDSLADEFKTPAPRQPHTVEAFKARHNALDVMSGKETVQARAQVEAQGKSADYTDASKDGDEWAGKPLEGFKILAHRTDLKAAELCNWPRKLREWAADWEATPDETYQAIRAIPDSEHGWQTFKTPYSQGFLEAMDAMIDRLRNGQPINAKGVSTGPGAVSDRLKAEIAASFARGNEQPAAGQYDIIMPSFVQ